MKAKWQAAFVKKNKMPGPALPSAAWKLKERTCYIMIGMIGAMKGEVEGLKKQVSNAKVTIISATEFVSGTIGGKEVVIAMCAPGKVNAAICTQSMILHYAPDIIINSGVAGGTAPGIRILDIAVSTGVVQHDVDTTAVGDAKALISGINLVEIPADEKAVAALKQAAESLADTALYTGIIATGDQFIASNEKARQLAADFGAVAVDMEGGSVGQVCYINRVPFAVVRAISDNGDNAALLDYPVFLAKACEKSIRLMDAFIARYEG